MEIDPIRTLRRAHPFRPFYLVLKDGRRLPVDRAHYLAISPDGAMLAHASVDGWFEWFPPKVVADVDFDIKPAEVHRQRETAAVLAEARHRWGNS